LTKAEGFHTKKSYHKKIHNKHRIKDNVANKIAFDKNLKILEYSYKTSSDDTSFECLKCNYIFKSTLKSVRSTNYGCYKCSPTDSSSYGERELLNIIVKIPNITYIQQYKFPRDIVNGVNGCKNKNPLPFDMWIELNDSNEMIIEIDGMQHFTPAPFYGGVKGLNKRRHNDVLKSIYCWNNNIPLLRVHYNDLDNLESLVNNFIGEFRYKKDTCVLCYSDIDKYEDMIKDIDNASLNQ
jgi:hypothetical protein